MRGFIFTVDMLYGVVIVILFFSIFISIQQPSIAPQQEILQIQAKDAVMSWFYSSPDSDPSLLSDCSASIDTPCACDIAFRPRVTSDLLSYSVDSDWVVQTVCVVAP